MNLPIISMDLAHNLYQLQTEIQRLLMGRKGYVIDWRDTHLSLISYFAVRDTIQNDDTKVRKLVIFSSHSE